MLYRNRIKRTETIDKGAVVGVEFNKSFAGRKIKF